MPITELRILPPLAIARLGASATPLAAYSLELPEGNPLDFRRIVPRETFEIDDRTGAIVKAAEPPDIRFRDGGQIRPVAPFLEVWAVTAPDTLEPLTLDLLQSEGLDAAAIRWSIDVANHKAYRRTGHCGDKIAAKLDAVSDHDIHLLTGKCDHFLPGKTLPLGSVRYIRPTEEFPEIRLRFTPAAGHVYGASHLRHTNDDDTEPDTILFDPKNPLQPDRIVYDPQYPWHGYVEPKLSSLDAAKLTNPGSIYAGYDGEKGWTSWGYLDDACDGTVTVELIRQGDAAPLRATAHISSGPPTFVPDALPIRTASDEMIQIVLGPDIDENEKVPIEEALEIVRRSLDSIRQLNTAVMNGNPVDGRLNTASTMVRQDSNDFGRMYGPIAASSLVDQSAVRALHERVFTALTSGSAPWFAHVLRQPGEIGDLSDKGRRKMPAMMRGADGRMLCLTRRQIHQIIRAASGALFQPVSQSTPA